MSQETVKYGRSLSGSIGAGMKSVFAGRGRRYYELVHKTPSRYHKVGSVQKIIIDSVELGRDPKCQVRFDESFSTVSRRHAAIVKDGEGWKLIQLSKTNPTYLNGNRVESSWYLQNGDEIQLASNGPVMGFVTPQGDAGLVKSIGLTNRLSLFRQQALRPYKTALWCLLGVLIAACAVGGWLLFKSNKALGETQGQLIEASEALEQLKQQQQEDKEKNEAAIASLTRTNGRLASRLSKAQQKIDNIAVSDREGFSPDPVPEVSQGKSLNSAIDAMIPGVYYIKTEGFDITTPDGKSAYIRPGEANVKGWSGTGFLLSDRRFVTARHVIEAWEYWKSEEDYLYEMNLLVNNGGKVVAHFVAVTTTGDNIRFTSDQMIMNKKHDKSGVDQDGYKVTKADLDQLDYAYMIFGKSGPIVPDSNLSNNLTRMTELTVLGFPLGFGAEDPSSHSLTPIYGNATVAASGLQNGGILTTNSNYEHGNSGGPVFAINANGKLVAVGIVSGSAGRNIGVIVPISSIY